MKKKLLSGLKIAITLILYVIFIYIALKAMAYMGVVWLLSDLVNNLLWLQLLWPVVILCGAVAIVLLYMRMKPKYEWQRAIAVFGVFVLAVAVNAGAFQISKSYFSVYTGDKWNSYIKLRHRMLDDLKSKYEFVGMSEKEVTDLLGEPQIAPEDGGKSEIGYVVGDSMIDAMVFFLELENGVVTNTRTVSYG